MVRMEFWISRAGILSVSESRTKSTDFFFNRARLEYICNVQRTRYAEW